MGDLKHFQHPLEHKNTPLLLKTLVTKIALKYPKLLTIIQDYLGLSKIIKDYPRLFRNIQDNWEISKIVEDYPILSRIILDYWFNNTELLV